MKKTLMILLSVLLLTSCIHSEKHTAFHQKKPRFGPYPNIIRSRIYGMGYPALLRLERGDFDIEKAKQGIFTKCQVEI